ncbi:MAG: LysR family transcriptional regulator [Chitinophagales bacterium]|nr:LysR family transcriptional regulator [Hyphomicrobiales bacterium]
MEMHQVRYFLTLCETLNFTRASEQCNVSQPSLSRAIRLLEEEFSGPLLYRERGNIHLSELGEIVKPYLDQLYMQAENAKRLAQDYSRLHKTPLRIGLMCTIAPVELLNLVCAIHLGHPGIVLQVVSNTAAKLHEQLLNGEVEAAIYALPHNCLGERVHYLQLYREQFMVVVHPDDPLAARDGIKPTDLEGYKYLSRTKCEMSLAAKKIFEDQNVNCSTIYESEHDDWIQAMVAAGLGFSLMPRSSVNHAGVVAKPVIMPEVWRDIMLVTVRGRPHSPALGVIVSEAMRLHWNGRAAIAVEEMLNTPDTDDPPQ